METALRAVDTTDHAAKVRIGGPRDLVPFQAAVLIHRRPVLMGMFSVSDVVDLRPPVIDCSEQLLVSSVVVFEVGSRQGANSSRERVEVDEVPRLGPVEDGHHLVRPQLA